MAEYIGQELVYDVQRKTKASIANIAPTTSAIKLDAISNAKYSLTNKNIIATMTLILPSVLLILIFIFIHQI